MYHHTLRERAVYMWLSDGGADGDIITRAAEPTLNDDNGGNETFAYVIQSDPLTRPVYSPQPLPILFKLRVLSRELIGQLSVT